MSGNVQGKRARFRLLRATDLAAVANTILEVPFRHAWLKSRSRAKDWETLFAYGPPILFAAVAVQFWFRIGGVLASGDLVPPVAAGGEYRAHWNDFDDGTGSPSYSIVWLPYFEGLRAFHWLGMGDALFQRVWLTLLLAGAAASVVFLARSLFRSPVAAVVAGLLSTFNAYRLLNGFDAIPLAAMVAAGLLGGLVLRRGRARGSAHPLLFAVVFLILGFVFVNPPHAVLVLAWLLVCVLLAWVVHGRAALRRIGRFLLTALPLALLFNLWWIVPAYLTLTGSVFAQRYAAKGVEQWAWTHQRASIPNVLSLTSSWGWLHPEYYPFSAELERMPFSVLQYVPAGAALLGVLLARGRFQRPAYLLAAVGFAAVWAMKGLHPPLGAVNLWLYHHVAGLWLFREPTKVGLVLVLVFSLLAALAIVELNRFSLLAGVAGGAVIVAAALAYAHPLLTGEMIADKRPLLPPAHVRLPSAWREGAKYLDAQREQGKVVVLPELDFYAVPTTWGYYGASFFHQLIDRPVIEPAPGGYYAEPVVSQLVAQLQRGILDGREDVRPLLRALGARYLLLRRDLDTSFVGRSFVAPRRLARALVRTPGLRRVRSFGLADLYEATSSSDSEVYPAVPLLTFGTTAAGSYRPLAIGAHAAFVAPAAKGSLKGTATGETQLLPSRTGRTRVHIFFTKKTTIVALEGRAGRTETVFPKLSPPLRIVVGRESFTVSDRRRKTRIVNLAPATAPIVYRFLPSDRIALIPFWQGLTRRVGDCNRYDSRTPSEVGLAAAVFNQNGVSTVRLGARDHSACVALPLSFEVGKPLRVRLAYRGISGNPPHVCAWEDGPQRCATLPGPLLSRGRHELTATVTPDPGTRSLRLFLYADGGGGGQTVTEYQNLKVERPQPAIAVAVVPLRRLPQISYRRVAPYEFRVHVRNAAGPFLLAVSETFAPGWHVEPEQHQAGRATHLRVNGYANGWVVPWRGTYDLKITYGPEQLALWAGRTDLVLIPLALLVSLGWWGLKRRGQLAPDRLPKLTTHYPRGPRASTIGLRQLEEKGSTVQAKFLTGARNVGDPDDKLRAENEELEAKLRVAEEELGVLESELGKFRDRESLITETLLAAQATANELRARAESDAKAMRHVAQTDIDALRRQFEQERDSIEQQLKVDADEIRRVADEQLQRAEQEREALLGQVHGKADEISRRAEEMREQVEQEREAILTQVRAEADEISRRAEESREQVVLEREAILAQARVQADEHSRAAERERADLASEIERLRMLRTDVEEAVRSLLHRALTALDGAPAEGQELEHLLTDALKDRTTGAPAMPAQETGDD